MTDKLEKLIIDADITYINGGMQKVAFSSPIGIPPGKSSPVTEAYKVQGKDWNGFTALIHDARLDNKGFPKVGVETVIQVDGSPILTLRSDIDFEQHPIPEAVFEKYSEAQRKQINILLVEEDSFMGPRTKAVFDVSLGLDWDDELIYEIDDIDGIDSLYGKLYDAMQSTDEFPRNPDFYIGGELVMRADNLCTFHLHLEDISAKTILEFGITQELKLKLIAKDEGFSVGVTDGDALYEESEYLPSNELIRGKDLAVVFPTKEEAMEATIKYIGAQNGENGKTMSNVDPVELFVDDKRIGLFVKGEKVSDDLEIRNEVSKASTIKPR
jgi:hypothetical protein